MFDSFSRISQDFGIESVFGPDWDDQVDIFCEALQIISGACEAFRAIPVATDDNPHGAKEASVKQLEH